MCVFDAGRPHSFAGVGPFFFDLRNRVVQARAARAGPRASKERGPLVPSEQALLHRSLFFHLDRVYIPNGLFESPRSPWSGSRQGDNARVKLSFSQRLRTFLTGSVSCPPPGGDGSRLSELIAELPERIYCVDRKGKVTFASRPGEGFAEGDMLAERAAALMSEDACQRFLRAVRDVLGGAPEMRVEHPLHNGRYWLTRVFPLDAAVPRG